MECSWLPPEIENTDYLLIANYCAETASKNLSFALPPDDEGLYEVPTGIIVLLSIFYGSISVISIVGNFLVMWIIATSRRMHNVTHYFIANLALADIMIGMFSIPFEFQAALLQRWNLPHFMCQFCPFIKILSVNVSIFTLTAIAVDRHRAVLNPLSARPSKLRAKIAITCVWSLGIILAIPMAVALRVTNIMETDLVGRVHIRPFCHNVHFSDRTLMYYRFILFLLQYAMPLLIISCAYARMAHRLWRSKAPGNAEGARDNNILRNKKKVIKMLVIVIVLFALCWLPLQTYNILQDIFPEINTYRYINIFWFCFDWLAMSNSCYNPFIYGIYNEKFKRELQIRFPAFRSRHWSPAYNSDSIDLDKTGHSQIDTRVSLRMSNHDAVDGYRNYSTHPYWQVHQVPSHRGNAKKSVHEFKISRYSDGKNYFDLKDNCKDGCSRNFRYTKKPSADYQFSPVLSSRSEDDNDDSGEERRKMVTYATDSMSGSTNELFAV